MLKAVSDNFDLTTNRTAIPQNNRVRGVLPYFLIEVLTAGSDALLIITASVLTGIVYNLLAFDRVGPVEQFIGIGFLSFVNFSAILAARAAYRPQNLANFWRQLRETTTVWVLVSLVLLAVAFLFKISGTYSRGATLAYFIAGLAGITFWRLVIAKFLAHALAVGAFAERNAVLLAEEGQIVGSTALEELNRCGYTLQRALEFGRAKASTSPLKLINEILDICRRGPVECVFLLVSWDDPRLIDVLLTQLRVLSIPIYLLPDRNVARFLHNRDPQYRKRLDSRAHTRAVVCGGTGVQAGA